VVSTESVEQTAPTTRSFKASLQSYLLLFLAIVAVLDHIENYNKKDTDVDSNLVLHKREIDSLNHRVDEIEATRKKEQHEKRITNNENALKASQIKQDEIMSEVRSQLKELRKDSKQAQSEQREDNKQAQNALSAIQADLARLDAQLQGLK
jgi:chromosome segregation ATPase